MENCPDSNYQSGEYTEEARAREEQFLNEFIPDDMRDIYRIEVTLATDKNGKPFYKAQAVKVDKGVNG